MAHISFNHLNPQAFNAFVPEATRTANNELIKNVLIVGGIALGIWLVYEIVINQQKKNQMKIE